ncbi:MAG: hypothetical protein Q9165_008306 [Trypethelium subeluteriae]
MTSSLLEYLRYENPSVTYIDTNDNKKKKSKTNTRNRKWYRPRAIWKWEDFNAETLHKIYGEQLGLRRNRNPVMPSIERDVRNESALTEVLDKWNRTIIQHALEEAQEHEPAGRRISMVRGHTAKEIPGPQKKPYEPDWAGVMRDLKYVDGLSSQKSPTNVLPGDTKISKKFSSADIVVGEFEERKPPNWYWPLAQVFTYCARLGVRYGYLVTENEAVVLRIGLCEDFDLSPVEAVTEEHLQYNGKVEFVSVPWEIGRGPEEEEVNQCSNMSVNTALWWIHMQAARSRSVLTEYGALEEDDEDVSEARQDSVVETSATEATSRNPSFFVHDEEEQDFPSFSTNFSTSSLPVAGKVLNPFGLKDWEQPSKRRKGKERAVSGNASSSPNTDIHPSPSQLSKAAATPDASTRPKRTSEWQKTSTPATASRSSSRIAKRKAEGGPVSFDDSGKEKRSKQ